jgi:regulatory protein
VTAGKRPRPAKGEAPRSPSKHDLHEAALAYLTRNAATGATLARTLERKVAAWARAAARAGVDPEAVEGDVARCREAIDAVVARLREVGLVNDAAFASARARRLSLAGKSKRAIAAHLAERGVPLALAKGALPDDELGAALVFAHKRRLGPFARGEADAEDGRRALAAMARAGFDLGVSERALGMDREAAEELVAERRRL